MVVNIKGISSNHPFLDKINSPKHVSVQNKCWNQKNYCLLAPAESPNALHDIFLPVFLFFPFRDNCMWLLGVEKECVSIFHRQEYLELNHVSDSV